MMTRGKVVWSFKYSYSILDLCLEGGLFSSRRTLFRHRVRGVALSPSQPVVRTKHDTGNLDLGIVSFGCDGFFVLDVQLWLQMSRSACSDRVAIACLAYALGYPMRPSSSRSETEPHGRRDTFLRQESLSRVTRGHGSCTAGILTTCSVMRDLQKRQLLHR